MAALMMMVEWKLEFSTADNISTVYATGSFIFEHQAAFCLTSCGASVCVRRARMMHHIPIEGGLGLLPGFCFM